MSERSPADTPPDHEARRTHDSAPPVDSESPGRNSPFDRRSFLRGVGAAAGVAGAFALGGCSQTTGSPPGTSTSSSKPPRPAHSPGNTVPGAGKTDVHI